MTEIIERIARAIEGVLYERSKQLAKIFSDSVSPKGDWKKQMDVSAAAIQAIRLHLSQDDVSALMVAARQGTHKRKGELDKEFVQRISIAYIDAAQGKADE